jgi:hypothetical protein
VGTASAAGAAQEAVAGAARNRMYPGARRGGPKSFASLLPGTEGSNPVPSSGESCTNLTSVRDGRGLLTERDADLAAGRAGEELAERSFGNQGDLTVLVEGDPRLLNLYDVILLNPAKHPVPKQALAERFSQWLLSQRDRRRSANMRWLVSSYSILRPRLQSRKTARAAVARGTRSRRTE